MSVQPLVEFAPSTFSPGPRCFPVDESAFLSEGCCGVLVGGEGVGSSRVLPLQSWPPADWPVKCHGPGALLVLLLP